MYQEFLHLCVAVAHSLWVYPIIGDTPVASEALNKTKEEFIRLFCIGSYPMFSNPIDTGASSGGSKAVGVSPTLISYIRL